MTARTLLRKYRKGTAAISGPIHCGIVDGKIQFSTFVFVRLPSGAEGSKNVALERVATVDEFNAALDRLAKAHGTRRESLSLLCSSSMDFPKEYTKDEAIICICHALRGSGATA